MNDYSWLKNIIGLTGTGRFDPSIKKSNVPKNEIQYECPYCKMKNSHIYKNQNKVMLYMNVNDVKYRQERWQCYECKQYFILNYELKSIQKLDKVGE